VGFVTAQPDSSQEQPYEVIHLGGETAAIVPLAELRRLRTLERHASPEALEEAEIEATLAGYREWVAAGQARRGPPLLTVPDAGKPAAATSCRGERGDDDRR
jgi:hypothetical protein